MLLTTVCDIFVVSPNENTCKYPDAIQPPINRMLDILYHYIITYIIDI